MYFDIKLEYSKGFKTKEYKRTYAISIEYYSQEL